VKKASGTFRRATGGAVGLLLLVVIIVAVNVMLSNISARLDLTGEKLYTLSDGTRSVLSKLEAPVTLKFFFNSSAPEIPVHLKNYARRVEDLLHEYRVAADGQILVEKYDPEPDSDAEEWAQRYGVSGQQIRMFGPALHLGLVAVSGDNEDVIPVLDPGAQELLEYHITRLIHNVVHPEKPVLGVMSSLPVLGFQPQQFAMPGQAQPRPIPAWIAFQELQQDYQLRYIDTTAENIGDDVQALIIVHPKDLPDNTLYAIDQFLLRGGRLLVFLDPFSVADTEASAEPFARPDNKSGLGVLLSAWGIGYDPGKILADLKAVTRIRASASRIEESPVWLTIRSNQMNRDDILTSQLDMLMLPFAGVLRDNTPERLTFTPLIHSSDAAGLVGAMAAQFGGQAIRREFSTEPSPVNAAVRVTGTFTTAFPDGKPDRPGAEGEESVAEGLKTGDSAVIVVADVDMISDRFCVQEINFFGFTAHQPVNDNIGFLGNAVEQVAGSSDLIGIRSRGRFSRPFDRVLDLEQAARREWQAREDGLMQKLSETQQQLRDLQSRKDESQRYILSSEQKQAVERFRQEEIKIKRELKDVRKSLRKDIERLGMKVKVANIALMPLLVTLAGMAYGIYRKRKK